MLKNLLNRTAGRPLTLWLLLWLGVFIIYLPAWKGGFQQDFEGWLYYYHKLPFWQLMNRKFAGIQSLYHVTQFELYILTKLFDASPVLWYLLFTGLHALNGVQLYRLAKGTMEDFGLRNAALIAGSGMLLALFNPGMTEVVMWKASFHYLVGLQAILWSLLWTRRYLKTGATRNIWYCLILFVPLTFTLEIWYTIPVLVLLLGLAYRRAGLVGPDALRRTLLLLAAPQLGLLGLHLLAYRLLYGGWIAHSAYTAPGSSSMLTLLGRIWSYEFHLLGLGRFYSVGARRFFYDNLGGQAAGAAALIGIVVLVVVSYIRFPRWSGRARIAALWAGFSLISLGIILHFPPPTLQLVYNDRYLYFTAIFQFVLLALGISWIWERMPRRGWALYGLSLSVFVAATLVLVFQWRASARMFWAIQDKFRWQDAPAVLLLNLPTNYNGIGIIQSEIPSEVPDHMYVFHRAVPKGKVYDVSGYNMQQRWNGAHVKVEDSARVTVTLNQWGSWWWRGGFGATDYENDTFAVHFTDPGHSYQLTLKKPLPPGSVLIYQQGEEFREVDMKKVGVEQW